ncbi:hypothetical protein ACQZV8_18220 [Magnetococcales bacterium HHB-1]
MAKQKVTCKLSPKTIARIDQLIEETPESQRVSRPAMLRKLIVLGCQQFEKELKKERKLQQQYEEVERYFSATTTVPEQQAEQELSEVMNALTIISIEDNRPLTPTEEAAITARQILDQRLMDTLDKQEFEPF